MEIGALLVEVGATATPVAAAPQSAQGTLEGQLFPTEVGVQAENA